ncbi:hypothetical protein Sjap_002474 [Stephania japonica]|uniref:Uncharacterized protein n=1 Tax=Stephania japonica TaxID=461633 RepID=A0AAP0KP97_9MAGN
METKREISRNDMNINFVVRNDVMMDPFSLSQFSACADNEKRWPGLLGELGSVNGIEGERFIEEENPRPQLSACGRSASSSIWSTSTTTSLVGKANTKRKLLTV